jgi:dihydrofolate reductase
MNTTLVVAYDENRVMGDSNKNSLPWHIPEDLRNFSNITRNHVLIMGRKTFETLPKLQDRQIICITSKNTIVSSKNECIIKNDIKSAIQFAKETFPEKKIFIAGGGEIYNYCLEHIYDSIENIHISIMNNQYNTDTRININKNRWCIKEESKYTEFTTNSGGGKLF